MSNQTEIRFNESQLNGIKAGLNEIAQGCMTLIKVLSMTGIPETDKYPHGREFDGDACQSVAPSQNPAAAQDQNYDR